mmetsp:Transcript_52921/g.123886  ORF Transcript_52921/g.123886 Transcript_52921/m.123886 type:complete len:203 (+) Transcript_52921:1995-2603(+)
MNCWTFRVNHPQGDFVNAICCDKTRIAATRDVILHTEAIRMHLLFQVSFLPCRRQTHPVLQSYSSSQFPGVRIRRVLIQYIFCPWSWALFPYQLGHKDLFAFHGLTIVHESQSTKELVVDTIDVNDQVQPNDACDTPQRVILGLATKQDAAPLFKNLPEQVLDGFGAIHTPILRVNTVRLQTLLKLCNLGLVQLESIDAEQS